MPKPKFSEQVFDKPLAPEPEADLEERAMNADRPLHENPVDYLRGELAQRQLRRSEYSLRAFARDLNLSPSTLSEVLNEKAGLSPVKSQEIARKLRLPSPHDDHFNDLVAARFARNAQQRSEAKIRASARLRTTNSQLAVDQFTQICDWYHSAILEMVDLSPRYHSIVALAKALKLKRKVTSDAVERLVRVGELEITGDVWKTRTPFSHVGEQVPSDAIKTFHHQVMRKAEAALFEQAVEEREFQTSFFRVDRRDLPRIKEEMMQFRRALVKKYGHREECDSVYSLSMQFIRLNEEMS